MFLSGCRQMRVIALWLLLSCNPLLAQSQKTDQESSSLNDFTVKLPVDVITINAVVTDREGKAVTDLIKNDFKIFEDGKLQSIQTFALESFKPVYTQKLPSNKATTNSAVDGDEEALNPPHSRLISILIDDLTAISPDGFIKLGDAVEKFARQDLSPGDQVAISSSSGRIRYPFTNNKQLLQEEARTILKGLQFSDVIRSNCPILTDLQARLYAHLVRKPDPEVIAETIKCADLNFANADKVAETIARQGAIAQDQQAEYRSRTLFQNLRQHIRSLKHFQARKELILFSAGFILDGELGYEFQDIIDQTLDSDVVFYSVDVKGLYNQAYLPADREPENDVRLIRYKQEEQAKDKKDKDSSLRDLADAGGGVFYQYEDPYNVLQEISNRESTYYVMTYAIPPRKADDQYHHIKLEVSRSGLNLRYRNGYYTPKEELTFERRKKEDILEGLRASGDLNEIPMDLGFHCNEEDDGLYSVSFTANASIRGLRFLDEDSRRRNLINVVLAIFDENGHFVEGREKSISFRLTNSSYDNLINRGLTTTVALRLALGRYRVKAVVREGVQGKMGSLTKVIEVP